MVPFDNSDRKLGAHDAILAAVQKVAADAASTYTQTTAPTPSTNSSKPTLWSKFDHASCSAITASGTTSASLQESLCHELDMCPVESPLDRSLCPFVWWVANQQRFPRLAKVGRQMLNVPATSVTSERLFSKVGNIISKKRNLLAPSTADHIVFLIENM